MLNLLNLLKMSAPPPHPTTSDNVALDQPTPQNVSQPSQDTHQPPVRRSSRSPPFLTTSDNIALDQPNPQNASQPSQHTQEPPVRRSSRSHKQPTWLDDYYTDHASLSHPRVKISPHTTTYNSTHFSCFLSQIVLHP